MTKDQSENGQQFWTQGDVGFQKIYSESISGRPSKPNFNLPDIVSYTSKYGIFMFVATLHVRTDVVLAKWIKHLLTDFQPTNVEKELRIRASPNISRQQRIIS